MSKTAEEMAKEVNETFDGLKTEIKELKEKGASKEEIETAVKAFNDYKTEVEKNLEGYVKSEDLDSLKTQLEDAEKEIVSLKEGGSKASPKNELKSAIESNHEEIKEAISQKKAKDFAVKANFVRADVANSTQALRIDSIGQLAHREFVLRSLFPVIPVGEGSNGVIRYADWDDATKVRAAAMIAEGGTFPESTAKFAEYTLELKKIGDTIPMTEESVYDIPRFSRELENFLNINISIVEDDQLYDGDGVGQNITGVWTRALTYTPVNSGIQDASIYDLSVKVAEAMTQGKRSKYQPNFVMMNITDINRMRLKKDADNNYIMPPFVSEDGRTVISMRVIESNAVTSNTMVVGDSRYGSIYEVEGYNVSVGYQGDQFAQDLMTLKAKKRLGLLIREADRGAFYKVTDIDAAISTLETAPV